MPSETSAAPNAPAAPPIFRIQKKRTSFLGLTLDECIQSFFGGNAFVAVIVLALITVFLFREGSAFFGQNRDNLTIYRQAGLEFVDIIRQQEKDHGALNKYLASIRLEAFRHLVEQRSEPLRKELSQARDADAALATDGAVGDEARAAARARLSAAQAALDGVNRAVQKELATFDEFAGRYADAVEPIRGLISELGDVAVAIKTKHQINSDKEVERLQLLAVGKDAEAAAVKIEPIDFAAEIAPLKGTLPVYEEAANTFKQNLAAAVATLPAVPTPALEARLQRFLELDRQFVATFPDTLARLKNWDPLEPVPFWQSLTAFVFGRQWLTASFWQDWYGVVPLFTGSLLISLIALAIAIPLGVGAAIYVNQLASPTEQRFIKPTIEFISAIPSVVLGFFGIAVLGEFLRRASGWEWLSWFPGFPFAERLNAFTAGCLLGLIAIPTIFTLAEDAINNVPRAFKEASFALGATRLQTITRIIVPAALSGIVSAVLLGLGRVIGETMVVLLCAGNRIAIPDFSVGLSVITQPVHTMTGIIAQELGEVARGTIHYRALFVVGMLLFFIALLINYCAQKIVRRYRISIG